MRKTHVIVVSNFFLGCVLAFLAGLTLSCKQSTTLNAESDSSYQSLSLFPSENIFIEIGEDLQLNVYGLQSDGSEVKLTKFAVWGSMDSAVASITPNGLITGLRSGSTQMQATFGDLSAQLNITVSAANPISISLNSSAISIASGSTYNIIATMNYSNSSTSDITESATWSSDNNSVSIVSNSTGTAGRVSAVGVGSAIISVSYDGVLATVNMTVTSAELSSFVIESTPTTVAKGVKSNLTATGTFTDSSTQDITDQVNWTSNNPAIATISNSLATEGEITGITVGTVQISASILALSANRNFDVTAAELSSVSLSPSSPTVSSSGQTLLTATGTYTDSSTVAINDECLWSSDSSAKATVSNSSGTAGLVSGVASGSTNINVNCSGFLDSVPLTVTGGAPFSP